MSTADAIYAFFGMLLLLDWLAFLPFFTVFTAGRPDGSFRPLSHPLSLALLLGWLLAILALFVPGPPFRWLGLAVLFLIFRHHFIRLRWSSIRRGGGAPGFMAHWAVLVLLLLESARVLDPAGLLFQTAGVVVRIDFAVIMICAGLYKILSGYLHGEGMEYGRANPMWGYHWRFFKEHPPLGAYSRFMNRAACLSEIGAGLLLLFPATAPAGAVVVAAAFLFVACEIRLGRLAVLMAGLPVFLYWPGLMESLLKEPAVRLPWEISGGVLIFLQLLLLAHVLLLLAVKLSQYAGMFLHCRLPSPWREGLDRYANAVPIIMWRVFTPDVTNFFVRVRVLRGNGAPDEELVDEDSYRLFRRRRLGFRLRLLHVTESIALCSVFTTLKYFPGQPERFEEKLRAYARSLAHGAGLSGREKLRFEHVALVKEPSRFVFRPTAWFDVDLDSGAVHTEVLDPGFDLAAPARLSPVQPFQKPGSYLPSES
jgi:hypothetical protein